jgi:hypothetical protein
LLHCFFSFVRNPTLVRWGCTVAIRAARTLNAGTTSAGKAGSARLEGSGGIEDG